MTQMQSPQNVPGIKDGSIVKAVLNEFKTLTGYSLNFCDMKASNKNADPKVLAKALAFLSVKYGVDTLVTPFIDVNAKRDPNFGAGYTLYIDQNTLTYSKGFYQAGTWEKYTQKTLKSNMLTLFKNYFASINQECRENVLEFNVGEILDLEHSLGTNYSVDETTRRNFTRWINPTQVANITYGFADWATFIDELSKLTGTNFVETAKIPNYWVLISEPDALEKLETFIGEVGIDTVVKYFYYRLLLSQQDFVYSAPEGTDYIKLYHESAHIGRQKRSEEKDPFVSIMTDGEIRIACAESTQIYMQYANARIFTEALYPTPEAREHIRA